MSFFVILVALLFANEILKGRMSNKYLQFSIYFFVSFTFFTFIVPVFIKEMNTDVFLSSGLISLITTALLILTVYAASPSTRAEIRLEQISAIIINLYLIINLFYFAKLIPPVPLALESGIVAHNIQKENNQYIVTYETNEWYIFWRNHRIKYIYTPGENVYIFSSIFAPTDIKKTIFHRWNWYNDETQEWKIIEDIGFDINGGRDGGFRGYTFKSNVKEGFWKVEVITEEELVIGVIDFEIIVNSRLRPVGVIDKTF